MGLGKGEGSSKKARSSWGGEIFSTHLFLPLQGPEQVQVILNLGLLSWDQVDKGRLLEIEALRCSNILPGLGSHPDPCPQQTLSNP